MTCSGAAEVVDAKILQLRRCPLAVELHKRDSEADRAMKTRRFRNSQ